MLTGTVTVEGRTFRIEVVPNRKRGTWAAVAGEGDDPTRWSQLGDWYASPGEAIAAAAGGVARLLARDVVSMSEAKRGVG